MSATTLLRNGKVICGRLCDRADVLIEGGRIAAVSPCIDHPGATVVDLDGMVLSPGFVDVHVHLRQPGFSMKETIRTGTRAAAAGGYATVCAMPNLNPVPDSVAHLAEETALIERDALIEVLPYGAITVDEKGQTLADIEGMAGECVGFSDDGKGVQSDDMMRKAMRRIRAAGKLLAAHCEDESLLVPGGCVHDGPVARRFGVVGISSASEWQQVARDLRLVEETGVRYHICHISTKETVALLREAKAKGLPVSGECTPHQLMLCEDDITENDGRFKMNPPLRTAEDREAIVQGLLDGTIDCIATDHAPHTAEEKARGLAGSAFGIVGLETAFAVCYTALVATGRCTLPFLLAKLTSAPAGVIGRTAAIVPGAPASLTAIDPDARWTVAPQAFHSMGRSTPFAGLALQGQVAMTWHNGILVHRRGDMQ